MNYKRKREIKTEPEDHVSDNIKAIPKDFVFGGKRGAVWGRKPFYECKLCQAELSSEQTVVDHLNGRRHNKRLGKRERDIKYGVISPSDPLPQLIVRVPVFQFGGVKIPAGPASWASERGYQLAPSPARKRRRCG